MKPEIAFGQVLAKYRKEKGLSQENLAHEASLDRTFISLLERGLRQPSLSTILRVSSALNVKPSTLIAEVETLLK